MDLLEIYPKDSRILFIGPYPPPLGGVSVHAKRLITLLRRNEYDVDFFDTSRDCNSSFIDFLKLVQIIFLKHYDIIHIQYYSRKYIPIIFLLRNLMKFSIYYTQHNPRLFIDLNKLDYNFRKKFIEKLDYLVVVAEHICESYEKKNIKLPKNVIIKNAFLPPPMEEESKIIQTYSPKTKEFIRSHKPIIMANAWQITFCDGVDLYGLDLCVELTFRLKDTFPKIGFLFAIANEKINISYIDKVKTKIDKLCINNNFHFITGQKELWPLFKFADLSVRPTSTDGDALSIRESIYFDCPVIASDVVGRPEGTTIFKNRNIDDLYSHICEMLEIKSKNSIKISRGSQA